jgi:hypothetical protein
MLAVVRNGPMHETWTEGYCAMIAASPAAPVVPAVPLSCNKVPPGNGYCDHCARGEYEKCRYTTPAAPVVPPTEAAQDYDWMPEARVSAAQCWCDPETSHTVMDPALAEAVARRIAAWMQTGAFHARNEAYWRDRCKAAEAHHGIAGGKP